MSPSDHPVPPITGEQPCPECEGRGIVEDGETCPLCEGTGKANGRAGGG